jgi:hypothetical protein
LREVLLESYRLLDALEPELKQLGFVARPKYRWSAPMSARRGEVASRDVSQSFFPPTERFGRFVEAVVVLHPGDPDFFEPLLMVAVHDLAAPKAIDDEHHDFRAWLYDLFFREPALDSFTVDGARPVFRLRNGRGIWAAAKSIRGFAVRLVALRGPQEIERAVFGPLRALLENRDTEADQKLEQLGDDLVYPLSS